VRNASDRPELLGPEDCSFFGEISSCTPDIIHAPNKSNMTRACVCERYTAGLACNPDRVFRWAVWLAEKNSQARKTSGLSRKYGSKTLA
jgi:hypothetical protein